MHLVVAHKPTRQHILITVFRLLGRENAIIILRLFCCIKNYSNEMFGNQEFI